jgi:hypothetical protein
MISKIARRLFSEFKPRVTQLLINGKFQDAVSGKTFATENPATEEEICQIA